MKQLSLLTLLCGLLAACDNNALVSVCTVVPFSAYAVTTSALYAVTVQFPECRADQKLADLTSSTPITNLARNGDVLYAVTSSRLLTLSISGVLTDIGPLCVSGMTALSFGDHGVLYGATAGGTLYTIDPASGAATRVGDLGQPVSGDLAFLNGRMYVTLVGAGSDLLVTVNVTTGAATVLGAVGFSGVQGLSGEGGNLNGLTRSGQVLNFQNDITLGYTGAAVLKRGTGLSFVGAE